MLSWCIKLSEFTNYNQLASSVCTTVFSVTPRKYLNMLIQMQSISSLLIIVLPSCFVTIPIILHSKSSSYIISCVSLYITLIQNTIRFYLTHFKISSWTIDFMSSEPLRKLGLLMKK